MKRNSQADVVAGQYAHPRPAPIVTPPAAPADPWAAPDDRGEPIGPGLDGRGPHARYGRESGWPDDALLEAWRTMTLARALVAAAAGHAPEDSAAAAVAGSVQPWREAVDYAGAHLLRDSDPAGLSPSGVAAWLRRGWSLVDVAAALIGPGGPGRDSGLTLGSPDGRTLGTSGTAGTALPVVLGAAWSLHRQGKDAAGLVYLDAAAASQADFHEAINFAGVWKAPLVVIMVRPLPVTGPGRAPNAPGPADRGIGYGLPGVRIDGTDLFDVCHAVSDALNRARRGEGPTIIEAVMAPPAVPVGAPASDALRTALPAWDPLLRFEQWLIESKIATPDGLASRRTNMTTEAAAAVAEARNRPAPAGSTAAQGVYA